MEFTPLETPPPSLADELLRKLELATKESNVLKAVIVALLVDLNKARGQDPLAPTVLWPLKMKELSGQLTLGLAKGKDVFGPQARLEFVHQPQEEVDRAMVLRPMLRQPAAPAEPKSNLILSR